MFSTHQKMTRNRSMKFPRKKFMYTAGIFLLCFTACVSNPKNGQETVNDSRIDLPDSLSLKEACVRVSAGLLSLAKDRINIENGLFYALIDSAADSLRNALGDKAAGSNGAHAIINVVYETWKIGFDPCDTLIETLLPELVCAHKKGACLGVSLIILMLAEKLKCPIYGVLLPGHFFCRFDDGNVSFNIEPNKSGFDHPDDYYRQKYLSGNKPWYDLRNLGDKEIIGILCFNAGNSCLKFKNYSLAQGYFWESIRRVPAFVEAKGNLAFAYAQSGDLTASKRLFDTLFNAYPDLNGLAANYGEVLLALKDFGKAREVFSKGLVYFPADSTMLSGLAAINR
jgi:tetratricopeptide (TPR) repeat protein